MIIDGCMAPFILKQAGVVHNHANHNNTIKIVISLLWFPYGMVLKHSKDTIILLWFIWLSTTPAGFYTILSIYNGSYLLIFAY